LNSAVLWQQSNSAIAQSRLQLARGNLAGAFVVLDQVQSESPRAGIAIATWKIRLWLVDSREHPEAMIHVTGWAVGRSLQPFEPYWTSFETLTFIRVLITQYRLAAHTSSRALPDLQALHEFLTKEIQTAEVSGNAVRLIKLHLLQSLAWHAMSHLSNARQSAHRLYLSPNTLKAHSQNIFMKLNVHNRLQAVNRARELGLIQ
jgi:hypothetical protein